MHIDEYILYFSLCTLYIINVKVRFPKQSQFRQLTFPTYKTNLDTKVTAAKHFGETNQFDLKQHTDN